MCAPAKFARVAEGLYRFSRKGKTSGPYYAYFWRDGKQIKKKLDAVDLEQARRELGPFVKKRIASTLPCAR